MQRVRFMATSPTLRLGYRHWTGRARTARVRRQVVGLFVSDERGSQELKGVPEPVTLFRLIRASGGGRRVGQRHLTPFVGRDEEIAVLMRRWERAQRRRPLSVSRRRTGVGQIPLG